MRGRGNQSSRKPGNGSEWAGGREGENTKRKRNERRQEETRSGRGRFSTAGGSGGRGKLRHSLAAKSSVQSWVTFLDGMN